jgi:hypothetical protein
VGSVSSKQLADSVTLPVARRFVKPGRLRIRATATDAAGNKSKPRTVKARLKR